jgi:hypothetical protein
MSLTTAQNTTLQTDINAQGSLVIARAAHDAPAVANFYNALSATAIWRSDLTNSQVVAACVMTEVVALNTTAGAQLAFQTLIHPPIVDATSANVRAAFSTLFSGKTTLTNLTAVAQRLGTRLEVLLGAGGPPAVSQVFGYLLQPADVAIAMGW